MKIYSCAFPTYINYMNYFNQVGVMRTTKLDTCGTFTATADTSYFIVKDAAGMEGNVLVIKSFTLTNLTKTPPCYDTLSTSQTGYAYRYNGQKTSPEIASGHQTALYWEYDARTGRRWNLDPVRQYFNYN